MLSRDNKMIYPFSKEKVFAATVKSIENNSKMKLSSADVVSGFISLNIGMSIWSWGEKMTITVTSVDANKAELTIQSASHMAVIDYGKNARNIEDLVQGISNNLK